MLSREDNEFLTHSGPGTPMGELLRRFWMPALLSEELPERDGPPKKIKILGEDLLAKLGRSAEAREEFERAAAMAGNAREKELLLERAASMGPRH